MTIKSDTGEDLKKRFDRWAKTYDTGRISLWFKYIHNLMLEYIDLENINSILDVGCGTGSAVILMSEKTNCSKICGIDISEKMIEVAKKKAQNKPGVEFKVGDSQKIPYPDKTFELVISSSSFHHYPNPLKALSEIKRVLKENGNFFLVDACRDIYLPIKIQDIYRRHFEKGHVSYYRTAEILDMLNKLKFKDTKLLRTVKGVGIKKKLFTGIGIFCASK